MAHGGSPLGVELGGSEGPRLQGPSGWSTAAAPEPWEDPEGLMRATALSRENGENKGAQGLTPPSLVGVSGGEDGEQVAGVASASSQTACERLSLNLTSGGWA